MSCLEIFAKPDIASDALEEVGVVRIPFTYLNSDLADMIRVYTKNVLTHTQRQRLMQNLSVTCQDVEHSSLYIFKRKCYDNFLQMAAKEEVCSTSSRCSTTRTQIIYSEQQDQQGLTDAEVFTIDSADAFVNIRKSTYANILKERYMHLVQVETSLQWNQKFSKISEFLLYVPIE